MPSCIRPARRDFVRRLLFTVFIALSLPAAARPAYADDPFVAASAAWSGPGGSAGVAYQGAQIWVDAFPDGLEGAGDTYHPVPALIDASWTLSLSPSRRNLIATVHDGPACNGGSTRIRVFVIPPTSAALTEPGLQQTLTGCLNPTLFFDSGAPSAIRTALFREVGTSSYDPRYLWWNLDTGERATSAFAFLHPSGFVEFAPSGTMAFVQHDVNGAHGGGTNYSLIDLCPAQIGQASQPGIENASVLHAWVVPGSPATVAYRTEAGATVGGAAYVDCSTSAPLGACCMPDGSCSDVTQAECAGTWHPEGLCAQVACPGAALGVSLTGPATVERGQPLSYTLTASNTGALSSSGVVVTNRIPTGSSFVSATAGGTYSAGTSTVTWTIGTLGGGQQAALGLTVLAPCSGSSLVNNTYSITGTPGGTVTGSPSVTTTLTAPSTSGLTLTLLSQALDATPLQTGGRVRHTIRMTNSLAGIRKGINFSVAPGTVARMLQVVNAGGGAATLSPTSLAWTGDLPASSTTDVVYDTEITECRSTKPGVEIMNWGNVVVVRNACAQLVAFSVPVQSFAVAGSPFELKLESPSHGPVQAWASYSGQENRLVACRPGATVNMQLRIINRSSVASAVTSVSLPLPFGVSPASDPPFLLSQPPGTQWNSELRTITWDGVMPANDSLIVRFLVVADSGACASTLVASGTLGTCANLLRSTLSLLQVPVPPAPHLLALQTHEGLAYSLPSAPQDWRPLLCGTFENLRGFGRTPDGSIWVAGAPSFRVNPYQLSFEVLSPALLASLGMDYVFDIAGDPTDSTLVFGGYLSGIGLRLRRYDPVSHQVTVLLNDTAPQSLGLARHVTVSADGIIGVNTNNGILRVDPANLAVHPLFAAPGGADVSGLALDEDGDWLTSTFPITSSDSRVLMKVDRETGVFTPIADLSAHFDWQPDMAGITTSPSLDVHLGSGDGQYAVVRRSAGNAVTVESAPAILVDLAWTGGGTAAVEGPPPGLAPAHLALAAPRPNPARGAVELAFSLPGPAPVTLAVYDVGGRRVRMLASGPHAAGTHAVSWEGASDSGARTEAGLYFVRLETAAGSRTTKLVLTR